MQFIIVSGLSGAGKSRAASDLEDLGFYCVDNLPISLVDKFAQLAAAGSDISQACACAPQDQREVGLCPRRQNER